MEHRLLALPQLHLHSQLNTSALASMDWPKATARRDEKFSDLVRLILKILRYIHNNSHWWQLTQVTPGNLGIYCFRSVSAAAATAVSTTAAVLQALFNFPGKPLKLISSNHTCMTYGCGKKNWHPSRWPWVKVTKLSKRDPIYLIIMIKWEPLVQSLQNLIGISPLPCFPPD